MAVSDSSTIKIGCSKFLMNRGPEDSLYKGGMYHGKLVFPSGRKQNLFVGSSFFPQSSPSNRPPSTWPPQMAGNKKWMLCDWKGNIVHVLPLGRFKTDTRLCLSISDYHPDTWNPAWSVSTILTGIHFVSGESNYEVTFSFCRTVELHAGEKSNPWLSGNVRLWEEAVCSEARSQQSWMKTVTYAHFEQEPWVQPEVEDFQWTFPRVEERSRRRGDLSLNNAHSDATVLDCSFHCWLIYVDTHSKRWREEKRQLVKGTWHTIHRSLLFFGERGNACVEKIKFLKNCINRKAHNIG